MIFWYDSLYMDDVIRKKEEQNKKIVEKRSFRQNFPWKKNFYIIVLANNPDNLFEIMNTNQMFFKYYEHVDLYVLGIFREYEDAVQMIQKIMEKGFERDASFDPRRLFSKNHFSADK